MPSAFISFIVTLFSEKRSFCSLLLLHVKLTRKYLHLERDFHHFSLSVCRRIMLSRPFLILDLATDIIGIITNTLALIYIWKKFDLKKTVFRLTVLDCFFSLCSAYLGAIGNIVWLIPKSNCWFILISNNSFSTFIGVNVSLLIAVIR